MGDLVPRHPHRDHPPGDHRADCGRPHRRSTPASCTPAATPPPRRPQQPGRHAESRACPPTRAASARCRDEWHAGL